MRLAADAGLTLAEMLVSLAIIAVMAGVAALSVGTVNRTVSAEIEARRLAAELTAAADLASVDRRPRMLGWDRSGWSLTDSTSSTSEEEPASRGRRDMPVGLELAGPPSDELLLVAPDGAGAPAEFLIEGQDRWRVSFDGLRATATRAGADT